MEHKLITGGEQWLPFARSRIKALRATGLAYASQQFELDTCLIRIRIEPGHEYIAISGGARITMDSGLVDVGEYNPLLPASFLPGKLYETQSVGTYQAPFGATERASSWRVNPNKAGVGQLAGAILASAPFSGRVPYDAQTARSFSPGSRQIGATPAWEMIPDETGLQDKKIMAAVCPASIFTGRARLYAQALYGRPAHQKELTDRLGIVQNAGPLQWKPTVIMAAGNSPPSLAIPAYKKNSDPTDYPAVVLSTSSGVFLDTATGKHWLLNAGTDLVAYPLISSTAGEALRHYLKASSTALGAEDLEHLEAYILSECRPYAKQAQTVGAIDTTSTWSMGYGWHWNWSGTAADIVVSSQFDQGGDFAAMLSTHYRLTVSISVIDPANPSAAQTWSHGVAIVEGPVHWALLRTNWVVTEPDWGVGTLVKTTPRLTTMFACDAPFYAFYAKDELKLCRVQVVKIKAGPARRDESDGFGSTGVTAGWHDGFGQTMSTTADYFKATVLCAGAPVLPDMVLARDETGSRLDVNNKTLYSQAFGSDTFLLEGPPAPGEPAPISYWDVGYPPYTQQIIQQGPGYYQIGTLTMEFDNIASNAEEFTSSSAVVVVPFYDAEAIYFRGIVSKTATRTGRIKKHIRSFGFAAMRMYYNGDGVPTGTATQYGDADAGGGDAATLLSTTSIPDEIIVETLLDESVMFCKDTTLPVTFGDLSGFLDNSPGAEWVTATFKTLSNAGNFGNAILAPGYITPTGLGTGTAAITPVFTGWA